MQQENMKTLESLEDFRHFSEKELEDRDEKCRVWMDWKQQKQSVSWNVKMPKRFQSLP